MKKTLLLYIITLITCVSYSQTQEFKTDEQYTQAMQNAKLAFEAQQFSEAVMFYREAMQIKPDALLPKYKVEDIRTIYIEKELDSIKVQPDIVKSSGKNRKKKKEIEIEKALLAEQAKVEATRKMNEDADKAVAEIRNIKIEVFNIDEDTPIELIEPVEVIDIAGDKEAAIKKVETKKPVEVVNKTKPLNTNVLMLEKREVPIVEQKIEEIEKEPVVEKHVAENKPVIKEVPQSDKPVVNNNNINNKVWIEEEQKRLATTYPNKKTIEVIEKPGKQIMRVIINIDNKVTIYLKVKHSWGATYFFIDEIGNELRSINEQYFNLMTNLKTYGG